MTPTPKPIRKTIYFDPLVLDALRILQQPQESLSLTVARLLRAAVNRQVDSQQLSKIRLNAGHRLSKLDTSNSEGTP